MSLGTTKNGSSTKVPGEDDPPEFKRALVDTEVAVGSSVTLLVEIKSVSETRVTWYHNDDLVSNSDRFVLLQDRGVNCVQIREATVADQGKWTCWAENSSGAISCFAILKTKVPDSYKPPEFIKGLRGCLWDNGTLSLECEVMGVPTPILRWYKDGKQLVPGASLKIKANSKESKSFLGIFACEAENCMGSKAIFSKVYARNFGQYLKQFRDKLSQPAVADPNKKCKKTLLVNTSSSKTSEAQNNKSSCSDNSPSSITDSGIVAGGASNNNCSDVNSLSAK